MHWSWQRNLSGLALLFFGAQLSLHAQSSASTVLKLNLENYGWQPLPKQQRGEWVGTRSQLVSIDHQGRVLVGFTVRENYSLATREHPGLSFHILRFTSDGKVDLSLVLPTDSLFTNGLYLGPNEQIFARANGKLQWASEETTTRDEGEDWRPLLPCPKNCHISQSPSRRTLGVSTYSKEPGDPQYDRGIRTNTVVDASVIPPSVIQDCPHAGGTITDKFCYQSSNGFSSDVRRWPLCSQERDVELPLDMRGGVVHALNDELLLLLGTGKERRGIDLVGPNGQLKFHHEMPKHDVVADEVRSDERGDRFAFTVQTWRGGAPALDIGANLAGFRVVLYSETGQELATVSLNQQLANVSLNSDYDRQFDFSLSPDGHRLAILDEGVITIVDTP